VQSGRGDPFEPCRSPSSAHQPAGREAQDVKPRREAAGASKLAPANPDAGAGGGGSRVLRKRYCGSGEGLEEMSTVTGSRSRARSSGLLDQHRPRPCSRDRSQHPTISSASGTATWDPLARPGMD